MDAVNALIVELVSRRMYRTAKRLSDTSRNPVWRVKAWDIAKMVRDAAYNMRETEYLDRWRAHDLACLVGLANAAMAELYEESTGLATECDGAHNCPAYCECSNVSAHVTRRTLARFERLEKAVTTLEG